MRQEDKIEITEWKGNGGPKSIHVFQSGKTISVKQDEISSNFKSRLLNWLKDVFLPQGYPHSVSSDYLQYQIWDSLQAYCSNLAGALSLHSTLVSIGVGQDSATPIAAALSWLMKDGTGMVSSITFAYLKGCELDSNSKQWRLFADVANDCAHFLNLIARYLPFPFLLTFCVSSVLSSLVGVAGGATRASLIQHQALCNNMADVSAKDGSQETLVNLAGLLTSLTLLPLLTSSATITWSTFVLCVAFHLYTNFKAMKTIQMKTLNRSRLLHILDNWTTRATIPDVVSTNRSEPLFLGPAFLSDYLVSSYRAELGVSLEYVSKCCPKFKLQIRDILIQQQQNFSIENYLLHIDKDTNKIFIIYHDKADTLDYVRSFWAAYLCAINLIYEAKGGKICEEFVVPINHESTQKYICDIAKCARETFGKLLSHLTEKEWTIEPLRLNVGDWRISINENSKSQHGISLK